LLDDITPYTLWHTTAALLLARGVDPKLVQELLGHATVSMTLDTNSH
jgi:integrase